MKQKSPKHETEYFVEPRQAFEIVGQELFGEKWQPECIDDPTDEEHHRTLFILLQALKSGEVTAHWSTLDFRSSGDLRPQDADKEFFLIMLKDDLVFHQTVNEPVRCRFHSEGLRRFLRGQEVQPVRPTQLAKDQCIEWLVEMFETKDLDIPKVEVLRRQAKQKFPRLSDHAFKEVRKLAIQKTGREDLAKPGRRKNPIGE